MFEVFDLEPLITTVGYVGLFFIVMAESGFFIGFFLPGDSLLFTAGFLASGDLLNIYIICLTAFPAAVIGDNIGYSFGKKIGPKIFVKQDGFLFNQKNIKKSQEFYEKYGSKTLVLARFMPIVRTFVPILAGVGKMHYRTFFVFNVIGALLWAIGLPIIGYFLGSLIPSIDRYILPIITLIILISIAPALIKLTLYKISKK